MEQVERATEAIMRGDFDHWGTVGIELAEATVTCWADYRCPYQEWFGRGLVLSHSASRDVELGRVGDFALRLHLSHSHLDEVINALGNKT